MPTGPDVVDDVTTAIPDAKRPRTPRNTCAASASSRVTDESEGAEKSKLPRNESINSRGGHVWAASVEMPSGMSVPLMSPPMMSYSGLPEFVTPVGDRGGFPGHPALIVD